MARRTATGAKGSGVARRHNPERTCVVTREPGGPDDLIRFVVAPDGAVMADVGNRLPGRGVWVGIGRGLVEKAVKQGSFARGFKRPVVVPQDLGERVEALLRRRVVEALSLANKAGQVVAGFAKVETLIRQGEAVALLHAEEAAADGAGKLDQKLRAVQAALEEPGQGKSGPQIVRDLKTAELSLALGRQNVVHAALRSGGAAKHFLTETGRYRRYRDQVYVEAARSPHRISSTE
ncbi:MAG: RNA-binding protein [Hyphomicrobiaceae bacterium]